MFQAKVWSSYSPTMRFVTAAGATMNSTTPSTSPTIMEIIISRCPNSSSSSRVSASSVSVVS